MKSKSSDLFRKWGGGGGYSSHSDADAVLPYASVEHLPPVSASTSFASKGPSHGPGPNYVTVAGNHTTTSIGGGISTTRYRPLHGRSSNKSNGVGLQGIESGAWAGGNSSGSSMATGSSVYERHDVKGGGASGSGTGSPASTPVPSVRGGNVGNGGSVGGGDGRGGHVRPLTARQRPVDQSTKFGPGSRSGSEAEGGGGSNAGRGGRGLASKRRADVVTIHVCDEGRGTTRGEVKERQPPRVRVPPLPLPPPPEAL